MDDKDPVAAREYPGCFTDNEVRQYLGQPSQDVPNYEDQPQCEGREVTPENHWLRDCLCAPFHVRCAGPGRACSHERKDGSTVMNEAPTNQKTGADTSLDSDIAIKTTLDELRAASESACWFCAVLFASISSMPSWDPTVPLGSKRGLHISRDKDGLYLRWTNVDGACLPEPPVILCIDDNIGTQHHPIGVPGSEIYPDCAISVLLPLPSASGPAAKGLCRTPNTASFCV